MSGRLAVNSEKGVWTGSLRWQQAPQRFVLTISAPLGQGALQIKGDELGVELRTASGHSLQSDDVDTLLQQEVGFELPVTGLRYWVLGLPQPGINASLTRDAEGKIRKIEQAQWQTLVQSYQQVDGRQLPRKISLFNEVYRIRLVIHQWQIT